MAGQFFVLRGSFLPHGEEFLYCREDFVYYVMAVAVAVAVESSRMNVVVFLCSLALN